MFGKIKRYFWLRKIIKNKQRALFEVLMDKRYFDSQKQHLLEFNEDSARSELGKLHNKEKQTEKEIERMQELSENIGEYKAVRSVYQKNETLRLELPKYIEEMKSCVRELDF